MRKIVKLPIYGKLAEQLLHKQQNRNNNESAKEDFDLSTEQKKKIKRVLLSSQKYLCCYCECEVELTNSHIEHFYEQHDRSDLVYSYDNFLLSCQGQTQNKKSGESCGHKKTKSNHNNIEIEYDLLLNPMNVQSEWFSYLEGKVKASKICNPTQAQQVQYTIQRLNLDNSTLNNHRINAITELEKILNTLTEEQQKEHIANLLEDNREKYVPFYSTIKDNLGFIVE